MKYLISLLLISFVSCADSSLQDDVQKLESQLVDAQTTIQDLKDKIEPEGELVHVVLFKLKPEADQKSLLSEIKKLSAIEQVKDLEVGPFEDVGDSRALSEFGMTMIMSFDSKSDYEIYQKHPVHLALRAFVGDMVSGPPATYDFLKK